MPLAGLKAQSKTSQVLGLEVRGALDRLVLVDEGDDLLRLLGACSRARFSACGTVWLTIFR